ncbi:FAD-binding protein, partial [Mycobacterium avium]
MSGPPRIVDVVVVGAGFAGLAAARELNRQGHD